MGCGCVVYSLTFLDHGGQTLILYTAGDQSDLSDYTLEAVTLAGDPVTDLPATFTAVRDPKCVSVSGDQVRAVMCDRSDHVTTLERGADGAWFRGTSYSSPSPSYTEAVTTTSDGGVALLTTVCY